MQVQTEIIYFHKDSGLELDFLVRYNGECVILEVKAKTGKAKSMATVLKNENVYHIKNAIKLGTYNVQHICSSTSCSTGCMICWEEYGKCSF